jgi:hypothetical protein
MCSMMGVNSDSILGTSALSSCAPVHFETAVTSFSSSHFSASPGKSLRAEIFALGELPEPGHGGRVVDQPHRSASEIIRQLMRKRWR